MSTIQLDAFRGIFKSRKGNYQGGLLCDADREVLPGLVSAFRPRNFLEIGVYEGKTSKMILDQAPWIERYVGVDFKRIGPGLPWPHPGKFSGFMAEDDPRFSMIHLEGEGKWDIDDVGIMDMVFIDGDHSFEGVVKDTIKARQLLRDGNGVIIWHDYNNSGAMGVREYIHSHNQENKIVWVEDSWICLEVVGKVSVSFTV
jgi:predicted O-methyltransferase YrrM